MRLIFICHPWAHNNKHQINTIELCRALTNGADVAFSPAAYFNLFLHDEIKEERDIGINCGLHILEKCDVLYSYDQHGITPGMQIELEYAERHSIRIEHFYQYPWE